MQYDVSDLGFQKQDKANFSLILQELNGKFDEMNNDLDEKENKLRTIENFIDRYIPIRMQ